MGESRRWGIESLCRLNGAWLWLSAMVGTILLLAVMYMAYDTGMPAVRVLSAPEVIGAVQRGRGFDLRYHVEQLRSCPGEMLRFAVGTGADGVAHQIDRSPVRAFRAVGEPTAYRMRPYMPGYLPAGEYVIRTVIEHRCGMSTQVRIMDSAPVRVE